MSAGSCGRAYRPGRGSFEHGPAIVERLEPRRLLSGAPGGLGGPAGVRLSRDGEAVGGLVAGFVPWGGPDAGSEDVTHVMVGAPLNDLRVATVTYESADEA